MALIGNMIADAFAGNPATVNYAMFTAVFSMLSLIYLVPASYNLDWSGHPIIMIVLDALNTIFFLAAGIALAARLHVHDCSNRVCHLPVENEISKNPVLIILGLHLAQSHHQWLSQYGEALP